MRNEVTFRYFFPVNIPPKEKSLNKYLVILACVNQRTNSTLREDGTSHQWTRLDEFSNAERWQFSVSMLVAHQSASAPRNRPDSTLQAYRDISPPPETRLVAGLHRHSKISQGMQRYNWIGNWGSDPLVDGK